MRQFSIAGIVGLIVAACGSGATSGMRSLKTPAMDPVETGSALSRLLDAYGHALYERDESGVRELLSSTLLEEIDSSSGLLSFMADERSKLSDALGSDSDPSGRITVVVTSSEPSGDVVSGALFLDGAQLPKEIFFVRENGEYRLSFLRPDDMNAVLSNGFGVQSEALSVPLLYTAVNNSSLGSVTFTCSGGGTKSIAHSWWGNWGYIPCPTNGCDKSNPLGGDVFSSLGQRVGCQWNFWGADVQVNQSFELKCSRACSGSF